MHAVIWVLFAGAPCIQVQVSCNKTASAAAFYSRGTEIGTF